MSIGKRVEAGSAEFVEDIKYVSEIWNVTGLFLKKTGLNYGGRCSGCSGGTRSEARDSVRNWEGKRKG